MADLGITALKAEVNENITTNGEQQITGAILNDALIDTIDTLQKAATVHDGLYWNGQAGDVVAKTIAADDFILTPGGSIKVRFENANTAASATLNVNGTGAHLIVFNGGLTTETNTWGANEIIEFTYNNYNAGTWEARVWRLEKVSVSQNTLIIGNEEKGELAGQLVESPEWVQVVTDSEGKILYGVKTDGKFYFGDGCPPQVQEYVQAQIDAIGIDALLATKVDKATGKSLIDADFASSQGAIEKPEWLSVVTDSEGKVLEGTKNDNKGTKYFFVPIVDSADNVKYAVEDDRFLGMRTDAEGKIIESVDTIGQKNVSSNIFNKAKGEELSVKYKFYLDYPAKKIFQKNNCLPLGKWDVPSYYNSYLDKKISDFSTLIRQTIINGDAFYFITDTHWEFNQKHSPALIKEMTRTLNIPRLFHGGDVYSEGLRLDKYGVDCINEFRYAIDYPNKVYEADGNHEYISRTETYGDTFAQYRIFLDDVVFGGDNKNYFYTDNKDKKIRYIVLASYGEYVGGVITYGFEDSEQVSWFRDVALNVESGWDIIIFCHFLTSSSPYYAGVLTINGAENIYNVVNNYQGNGNILAFLTGHTHYDCISMDSCDVPIICSTCDHNMAFQFSVDGQGYTEFSDLIEPRIIGTITEQAFDVVIYDKEHSLLHLCRFGSRAMNRTMNFPGNAQVDYRTIVLDKISVGGTKYLVPVIDGSISWASADSEVISVSNGLVTANSEGNTVVTATSNSGEIQSFFIRVVSL